MNWIDISISFLILLFMMLGLWRGVANQIISLVSIIAGIVLGIMFYDTAGSFFMKKTLVKSEPVADIAGFGSVFVITVFILKLAGWVITGILGKLRLRWVDRLTGGIFGALKGVVLAFIFISILGFFLPPKEPPLKDSVLIPYVSRTFLVLKGLVPEDFMKKVEEVKKFIHKRGIKALREQTETVKESTKEEKENKGK